MAITTQNFVYKRSTGGTHVYRAANESGAIIEDNRQCIISDLYVQKSSELGKANPDTFKLTIEY